MTEQLPDGVAQGSGLSGDDLDMMIATYYEARGWNEDGTIPQSKLAELGIGVRRQAVRS